MNTRTKIELFKESMKFSAGHFTLFSASKRERLHGHNFFVHVTMEVSQVTDDLAFDYGIYKRKIQNICDSLNEYFLLPQNSPFLQFEEDSTYLYACFGAEKIPFIKTDIKLLPIANVTLEGLAKWFVEEMMQDSAELRRYGIEACTVKVYSGPGQSCEARRERVSPP